MAERVFVGMSGGVDSALAVALLVEQGYDVRGIYMRNWTRDLPGFRCPWAEELADAERVAATLGIPLDVWDCEAEYKATVADYLVDAYAHGYTPNPDVMCNQTIKFGSFAERAFAEGADLIATGHYARTAPDEDNGADATGEAITTDAADKSDGAVRASRPNAASGTHVAGGACTTDTSSAASTAEGRRHSAANVAAPSRAKLLRACDEHKDQTYFLWRVGGEVLARTLFPVGGIRDKAEVRRMCAERGLGVEAKPDSDGICFIGPVGIRTFLLDALERRVGDVVEWETGAVLGQHEGAFLFTVGQRRGLDLGGGPARYVVATDVVRNVVYVTADRACPALWTDMLVLEDCRWIAGRAPEAKECVVRTRHTGPLRAARVEPGADGAHAIVRLAEPQQRVAPGQSAVLYDGLRCLGGGLIAKADLAQLRDAPCATPAA